MIRKLVLFLGVLFGGFLLAVLLGVGVVVYFSYDLPKITTLADYKPAIASKIISKDGVVLAEVGVENREIVAVTQIPKRIIDAFLSAEDDNFFNHTGVDYVGVARAFIANLKAGRVVQGGSTITQQVAKSLLLSSKRSYARKIKDFLLAQKIEKRFTKKEILFLYLNQVYLGGGYYGIKTAFRGYFNKELSEATVAEAAVVAGLLVAPGRYSPYVNPKYAKIRQSYVLKRMYETKRITEEEYKAALSEKIKYYLRVKEEFKAGYFTDWVRQRVVEKVGEKEFLRGGFEVQTTLDYELQQQVESAMDIGLRDIDKRQGFKGSIGKIDLEAEGAYEEYVLKYRKTMLKEKSEYFTLDEDSKREYNQSFDEEKYNIVKEDRAAFKQKVKNSSFIAGNSELDDFAGNIEKEQLYKALVIKVDNSARLIYISIGGVYGVIPYRYFRWAHERIIKSDRQYFPYVTKPSTIVQPGDFIWTEFTGRVTSAWSVAESSFRSRYEGYSELDLVKKQKFLLCKLEQKPDVQGAMVALSPHSGEIISFIGGSNFRVSQFNRVIQSSRQPGSSFKPILYSVALENGYTPASIILDAPEALAGVDESLNWKPRNYDGKFLGPVTLREALEHSRNVPAIKVAQDIGVDKIINFVKRVGDDVELPHDLSVALGSFGISLLDLTSTYALFPNGGRLVDAVSIISVIGRDGISYQIDENKKLAWKQKVAAETEAAKLEEPEVSGQKEESPEGLLESEDIAPNPFLLNLSDVQVFDKRLAYIMTKLLQGVVLNGTGRSAKGISSFLAGKTGTTNKYIDALFVGFSSKVSVGVWTGFDDNQTLGWGETGAKAALPIWKSFMQSYIKKYGESDFTAPDGVLNVQIDRKTGELSTGITGDSIMEVFVKGTEPGTEEKLIIKSKAEQQSESKALYEDEDFFEN
jgi:penicillin-binding protein 1A